MNDIIPGLAYLLVVGFFTFVIFLVIRQLVLWYWRINEMADNIAYIADHYRAIDQQAARERIEQTRRTTSAESVYAAVGSRPTP